MAFSYISYPGNDTQTDYTFPFLYIDSSDIYVTVDAVPVTFSFINSSAIRCTVAPAAGSVVLVKRVTQKVSAPVNFTDGSVLLEKDLDTLVTYTQYIAQEQSDGALDAYSLATQAGVSAGIAAAAAASISAQTSVSTHAATSKATPVDADEFPLVDSATSNILAKVTFGNLKSSILSGTDNRILNSIMRIDQRFNGAAGEMTGYRVDRWQGYCTQTGKIINGQNATGVPAPVGIPTYLGAQSTSSYALGASDYFILSQSIKGQNIADFCFGTASAKPITISFKVYSTITGMYGGYISNYNGTRFYGFTFTALANSWNNISVTIPGDTSGTWLTGNNVGMFVRFSFGAGTSAVGPAGVWGSVLYNGGVTGQTNMVSTSGSVLNFTDVRVNIGSVASTSDRLPIELELLLCQGYCETLSNVGGNSGYMNFMLGALNTASQGTFSYTFKVTKRSSVSMSYSNLSDFAVLYNGTSSPAVVTAFNLFGSNTDTAEVQASVGVALTPYQFVTLAANANITTAKLIFSAELS